MVKEVHLYITSQIYLGLRANKLVVPINIAPLLHVIHACNFLDQLAYTQES